MVLDWPPAALTNDQGVQHPSTSRSDLRFPSPSRAKSTRTPASSQLWSYLLAWSLRDSLAYLETILKTQDRHREQRFCPPSHGAEGERRDQSRRHRGPGPTRWEVCAANEYGPLRHRARPGLHKNLASGAHVPKREIDPGVRPMYHPRDDTTMKRWVKNASGRSGELGALLMARPPIYSPSGLWLAQSTSDRRIDTSRYRLRGRAPGR